MTASERAKKPRLKRTKPIRSWSGVFEPPPEGASVAGSPASGPATNGAKAVPEAVQLGYTVIQDYLNEARQEAQRIGGTPRDTRASAGPERLTQRLFQYTSDLTNLWLEVLQASTQRDTRREPPRGTAGPFVNGYHAEPAPSPTPAAPQGAPVVSLQSPSVSLKLCTSRRVEATIELRPAPIVGPLVAHELRAADPDAPRVQGIELEYRSTENRVHVSIRIPSDLPEGVYSGLFLDRSDNLPRGTLTVTVLPQD